MATNNIRKLRLQIFYGRLFDVVSYWFWVLFVAVYVLLLWLVVILAASNFNEG